ncbi:YbaB/EbfC family nucleoid-associated protein [Actinomadura sp. HBU206391]|uniref:YbaB/EbfC family nucleoid-associated protein n=1 Tax=Actinomadura sp. HBU206391 TaxID=2731692 RepID=UPI0016505F39|nr:YbaB/EbfC family nucleoid-associated protein [Actinomadura sp. HBU206391]MBC6460515.1 YbaB/EbfC family nucleoid-associated protein [Actinomadura sp. HBU206391]
MREDLQAHLDELMKQYRAKRSQLQDLQRQMGSAQAIVEAADGMVTVTVGAQGRLTGLEFDPRVYRRLSPSELAECVLAAVNEAAGQVGDQVRAVLEPLVPADTAFGDVDGADLSKVLPQRPDDLEAMKQRYGLRDK